MSFDLSQFHQTFFDETREHLDEMERLLLSMDVQSPEPDDLDAIFRAAHSIKGGSGTFGFTDMADVTHVLESLLDLVRKQQIPLTPEIIEASLQAGDILRAQLSGHRDNVDFDPQEAVPIIEVLKALSSKDAPVSKPTAKSDFTSSSTEDASSDRVYVIHYAPERSTAASIQALEEELARLGRLEISGSPAESLVYRLSASILAREIEDIFSFVAQPNEYRIEQTAGTQEELPAEDDPAYGFFDPPSTASPADTLIEGDGFGFFTDPAALKKTTEADQGYGFFTEIAPPAAENKVQAVAIDAADTPRRRAADREADTSIRVGVEKVDQLINLVGELIITNAMLAQTVSQLDPVQHQSLLNGMGQLERNSRDLQESVMSIRMLPINAVFSRFPRLVRDLAGKLGKQIELKMVGESTELDKGLIERLADPLTHLVRNSLDHGIEMPDVRIQNGKPAKGVLTLSAFHQGGSIVVEVLDDGAGLNRDKIIAKARERGIAIEDDAPDQEVWQLIMAAGFSTAEQVTDVSGRGVGMDVVKRNIEGMGGRVEISSKDGNGTRITIRLPLTLAILDGMSIGVGMQVFIVPINMIVESLQPKPAELSSVSGKGRVVHVRGEYLPLIALHEVFGVTPCAADPCEGILVILEIEGGKVALFVDELLGQHQVVIKSLETNYRKVRGVSGATIMGDGRVAMILDVAALVQLSRD